MSQGTARAVADTVILRYFLLVEHTELLVDLLGVPIFVPRVVFDPDEGDVPLQAMSEMTRSIQFQRTASTDPHASDEEREQARTKADRLAQVHNMLRTGHIQVTDLSHREWEWFARLTDKGRAAEFGLRFGLGAGEAAAVAIAVERGFILATDDEDGLKAVRAIKKRHPYQRIRKMLIEATEQGLLSKQDANAVHEEMRWMGFWDKSRPFRNVED